MARNPSKTSRENLGAAVVKNCSFMRSNVEMTGGQ
jgi:hypothetical protein